MCERPNFLQNFTRASSTLGKKTDTFSPQLDGRGPTCCPREKHGAPLSRSRTNFSPHDGGSQARSRSPAGCSAFPQPPPPGAKEPTTFLRPASHLSAGAHHKWIHNPLAVGHSTSPTGPRGHDTPGGGLLSLHHVDTPAWDGSH